MTGNANKPDYFQFRWGVKEWDVGFTTIPNPVLKHYSRVAWIDKDGRCGCGITNQEVLCIIHIASFHYESERGEARPAIPTVRQRMGYKKDDSISGLIKSLEHKNLLVVERKSGKCNVYSLRSFSQAIVDMDNPPIPMGGSIPVGDIPKNPPIPMGDNPPISMGVKNKTEEEKPKEEKKKRTLDPLLLEAERETLEKRAEAGGNYADPAQAGGADRLADAALFALYAERGKKPPKKGTKQWQRQRSKVAEALKAYGYEKASLDLVGKAAKLLCERKGDWTNVFHTSFPMDFGQALSDAENASERKDRRHVRDIEVMQESLAALNERRTARPPPPQDDVVGRSIKALLKPQMARHIFLQYVKFSRFACEDGTLRITAPNAFTRAWLENCLGATIRRALAGVTDGPKEVVFEVSDAEGLLAGGMIG